jgi:DNA-binding NarL/FixJ family response regulator
MAAPRVYTIRERRDRRNQVSEHWDTMTEDTADQRERTQGPCTEGGAGKGGIRPPAPALTPRELDVLRALAVGLQNKEIAARLGMSERTVKFHVGSIFRKLGAGNRTEAVTLAMQRGLVEPPH